MSGDARHNGMHSRAATVAALGAFTLLAGCGDVAARPDNPAGHTYEGPLYRTGAEALHPGAGAAGEVVDCTTWGDGGFSGEQVYNGGATADSPAQALKVSHSEGGFGGVQTGLLVAKEEKNRMLYVLEVEGVVKQAIIVHNGPATEGAGGSGWYVESWAHCDYSELPRTFTDSIGLQIWAGDDGRAAPTTKIASWTGPEHCDWQSMTFLNLGKAVYVRSPQRDLADYFADPYEEDTVLPVDAIDTGFQRDGNHLWLSADKQRAFVGSKPDVEAWPRTIQQLGCL